MRIAVLKENANSLRGPHEVVRVRSLEDLLSGSANVEMVLISMEELRNLAGHIEGRSMEVKISETLSVVRRSNQLARTALHGSVS